MLTKEQIEQAIQDWTQTLEWAKEMSIDDLYEKSKENSTQHGLCWYFSVYEAIFDEFIEDNCEYICETIARHHTFGGKMSLVVNDIKKRIKILNILLSRC